MADLPRAADVVVIGGGVHGASVVPGLFVDFGWSGHGFKHAPVVGAALADVVLGRPSACDLGGLRGTRFREGDRWPAGGPAAPAHAKLAHRAGPAAGPAIAVGG